MDFNPADVEPNEDLLEAMRQISGDNHVPVAYILAHIQYLLNEELQAVPSDDPEMIEHITKEIDFLEYASVKIENGDV